MGIIKRAVRRFVYGTVDRAVDNAVKATVKPKAEKAEKEAKEFIDAVLVCPYCGGSIAEGKQFCPNCGKRLVEEN